MAIRFFVAVWAGKLARFFLRLFGREAGTWPGEIALRIDPNVLSHFSSHAQNIILIAGTNGKTTTAKMIETILKSNEKSVFHNESGANLDNGIVSSFLKASDWAGNIKSDYCIFEVDEATLPIVLKQMTPKIIVLLNLFRDQLDRYGEVDSIVEKWLVALSKLDSGNQHIKRYQLLINADDPHLAYIGAQMNLTVKYFGLEDPSLFKKQMQHATDTIYCPNCNGRLTFGGVYFSHLGKWSCGHCGFTHPKMELTAKDVTSPLEGVYNRYNTLAAVLVAKSIGIDVSQVQDGLQGFQPAFGRMEDIHRGGKRIRILLSKNPTGFNESLRTAISSGAKYILLVLNDRIPDGRDVSWIWDVDFETLKHDEHVINKRDERLIFVSGDRYLDLSLRLKYAEIKTYAFEKTRDGVTQALKATRQDETLWILPTYSAMLEVRAELTGRKIL